MVYATTKSQAEACTASEPNLIVIFDGLCNLCCAAVDSSLHTTGASVFTFVRCNRKLHTNYSRRGSLTKAAPVRSYL